jgi:hypothetical protein
VDLVDELGQLIERVNGLKAHENKRRVHQIKIEMHQRLETKCFLRPRADIARGRKPNSVRVGKGERPAKASPAKETEGFRRRGSDGFVANLFLAGGFVFDDSCLPVYAP